MVVDLARSEPQSELSLLWRGTHYRNTMISSHASVWSAGAHSLVHLIDNEMNGMS
jgi:hypothetical protein|uniref:Uncharacterized protein n=1 Tax=Picea glauca TaxID=3330 RepID=A0A101LU36_PICGL|nr:hypothetical protein ABT39_MTgene2659 [Picea glauca]